MRAPQLLAKSLGYESDDGAYNCFYCGAPCDGTRDAEIKPTFTEFSVVAEPASTVRCLGCELAMREKVTIPGKDKPQKMRNYSWLITSESVEPYNKSDVAELRRLCLDPPAPPFALAIAVSGQKHILYHTLVCEDAAAPLVSLEGEPISYSPTELAERLDLVTQLVAAAGKPALADGPGTSLAIAVMDRYADDGEAMFKQWQRIWSEPLSALARFLAPPKQEASDVYPKRPHSAPQHPQHGLFSP